MITMTKQHEVTAPTFLAQSFRFSDDPAAMARFLELLGLGVLVSAGTGWYDLRGRSGSVALHSTRNSDSGAAGGTTGLVLVAPDVRRAAAQLEQKGLRTRVWDESFGVQAAARTPFGGELPINEEQRDFYGYQRHEPTPGPIDVVTVFFTDDLDGAARFFELFGFRPDPAGSEDWHALRNGDRGVIGLHRSHDGRPSGTVGMSFETGEDLAVLADRLRAAGHRPILHDGDQARLEVTDPDGIGTEIWPSPL
ncbi:MAG TPA: hypothetical protein VK020_03235 [Microlunatus sp.]|nr:hypothetical protein [Microlunatus sp.]